MNNNTEEVCGYGVFILTLLLYGIISFGVIVGAVVFFSLIINHLCTLDTTLNFIIPTPPKLVQHSHDRPDSRDFATPGDVYHIGCLNSFTKNYLLRLDYYFTVFYILVVYVRSVIYDIFIFNENFLICFTACLS